jgi:hypothetical protein
VTPAPQKYRAVAAGGLFAYALFASLVAFWPTPADRGFDGTLIRVLTALQRAGAPG